MNFFKYNTFYYLIYKSYFIVILYEVFILNNISLCYLFSRNIKYSIPTLLNKFLFLPSWYVYCTYIIFWSSNSTYSYNNSMNKFLSFNMYNIMNYL